MANIKIQWSLPDFEYDYFELKYSLKSDSNISYSYLSTTDNSVIITGLEDNTIYLGGVRTVKDNYKSEWVFFEINTCDIQFPTPTVTPTISLTPTSSVVPTPTPTITLSASNILPICTEGPEILEITSVNNNSLSFEFHGIDVFDIRWDIYQNNLLVRHGIVSPSSSNVTINYSYLNDGNYKIDIQGASCTSSVSSMIFNISSALPQPTSSVTPTITPTPTITASPNEGGMQIFDIGNPFLNVAKETTTGTFSPQKFPNVTIPTFYDDKVKNQVPYFIITANTALAPFNESGVTPFQKGIWSWRDNQFTPCVDFWDNCPGIDYEDFISPLPYNERYDLMILPNFQPEGLDIVTYFTNKTTEQSYNLGLSIGGPFGLGDSPDGFKTRRAVHENDVEISLADGNNVEVCKKMSAFFGGIADRSLGFVFAEYLNAFQTLGYTAYGRYPDDNGNFLNEFTRDDNTGLTWRIASYWYTNFTLNGDTKSLNDFPNLYGIEEVSHHSEDSWEQDKLVYSPNGTYLRKVNHFGTQYDLTGVNGYNVDHVISRATSNIETDVAYHAKFGRDAIHMFKIVCDRGEVWLWEDTAEFNSYGDRSVLTLPRHVGFMGIIMSFMSGSRGEQAWGEPQADSPGDGYNSIFGASTILNKVLNINGQQKVLSSMRPNLKFHQWFTYQSYDNGSTWIQHKALDWKQSKNYLPLRIATTNEGYIIVFACRPYNVEPLSIRWKVDINGTTHYGSIGSNDWYSCYPVEEPNRKDYYFKIIKV